MDSLSNQPASADAQLLTVEEFAVKMKVARTTVFNWLKTEKLRQGTHYIKIGRVIRFQWPEVLKQISEADCTPVKPLRPEGRRVVKRQTGVAINLQYD